MSSIQFNYFADEEGERIIKEALLDRFGSLYVRDSWGKMGVSLNASLKT